MNYNSPDFQFILLFLPVCMNKLQLTIWTKDHCADRDEDHLVLNYFRSTSWHRPLNRLASPPGTFSVASPGGCKGPGGRSGDYWSCMGSWSRDWWVGVYAISCSNKQGSIHSDHHHASQLGKLITRIVFAKLSFIYCSLCFLQLIQVPGWEAGRDHLLIDLYEFHI